MGNEIPVGRLTTKGVGKKNMRLFIDAILEKSDKEKWELKAPDKELRKKSTASLHIQIFKEKENENRES